MTSEEERSDSASTSEFVPFSVSPEEAKEVKWRIRTLYGKFKCQVRLGQTPSVDPRGKSSMELDRIDDAVLAFYKLGLTAEQTIRAGLTGKVD